MKRSLLIGLLGLAWTATSAQPTTGGPEPSSVDPAAVPIDGGASLAIAVWRGLRLAAATERPPASLAAAL